MHQKEREDGSEDVMFAVYKMTSAFRNISFIQRVSRLWFWLNYLKNFPKALIQTNPKTTGQE